MRACVLVVAAIAISLALNLAAAGPPSQAAAAVAQEGEGISDSHIVINGMDSRVIPLLQNGLAVRLARAEYEAARLDAELAVARHDASNSAGAAAWWPKCLGDNVCRTWLLGGLSPLPEDAKKPISQGPKP